MGSGIYIYRSSIRHPKLRTEFDLLTCQHEGLDNGLVLIAGSPLCMQWVAGRAGCCEYPRMRAPARMRRVHACVHTMV